MMVMMAAKAKKTRARGEASPDAELIALVLAALVELVLDAEVVAARFD